jgi:polygalacturonase
MLLIKTIALNILFAFLLVGCMSVEEEKSTSGELENPWDYAAKILDSINAPEFRDADYYVTDFGANGDGKTNCSAAIAKAINTCSEEGGGRVIIPDGVYLTGAVHLKSNVNLHLSEEAILLFTTDKSKFLPVVHTRFEGMECMNYSPFIYAYKQENIAITGKGTIDGQGSVWWNWKGTWEGNERLGIVVDENTQNNDNATLTKMVEDRVPLEKRVFGEGHYLRPSFISPYNCKNILISDVTLKGSPMWNIHPILCENVTVRGVRIESLGPNNDGCNPECSRNVLIENCYFNTGDDCIAIKSGRNNDGRDFGTPSENIIVRNSTMAEGHGGVVIGSEISGNIRYVFAENCIMDSPNLERAIRIKSNSVRGGMVEHIYVRDIEVKQVREAILKINMFYARERGTNIPVVRHVLLENITGQNSEYGVWIKAYKEAPVENVSLKNCTLENIAKNNYVENVRGLTFTNVKINGEEVKN